ncbi:MAG TPA: hypothetical protein VF811_13750 [Parasulfuritortus sp.]
MNYGQESFERGQPLMRTASTLPAATYNLTRILLAASTTGCVFVPIRSMQYLAVIDQEEIIFVDSQVKRWVTLAWRGFRPHEREALDQPVAYEAVYYTEAGADIQRRLLGEFHTALMLLDSRARPAEPASVLPYKRKPAPAD